MAVDSREFCNSDDKLKKEISPLSLDFLTRLMSALWLKVKLPLV